MLCSTANETKIGVSRVGLLIRYSDRIKAYKRIGICDLCSITLYVKGVYWGNERAPTIEEKSSTHATLGPFQLVKTEIRLG
jgi:hypothetical protein